MSTDDKSLLKKLQNNDKLTDSPKSPSSDDPNNTVGTLIQSNASSNTLKHISPDENTVLDDQMKSSLSFFQKIGFGLGHVYNDLCAGVWFSYTLLFMQGSLQMSSEEAGILLMLGQVGDALATPIVGILTDKYSTKKKWHISGTGLVLLTFPLIFSLCPWCTTAPKWWIPTYFAIVILLFQLGWAIVQITHLAMIPEISRSPKDRTHLTAVRYSVSVCSNVLVFVVTWLVLRGRNGSNIGPADANLFRDISLILTLVGICMTVCFYFSLSVSGYNHRREQALEQTQLQRRSSVTKELVDHFEVTPTQNKQKNFFKSPLLYQNAFLYVFSRLFMCISLVYIPLWLDERTWTSEPPANEVNIKGDSADNNSVEHIATVPLVSFLSSFAASIAMKYSNRLFGHRVAYCIGSLISILGCIWVALGAPTTASSFRLYCIAVLFGAGSSVTMISSLCISADMIGKHADQGGFIYSAVTFADKLITGIVVIVIEAMKCEQRSQCPEYYRNVLAYACGVSAVLGLLILSTLKRTKKREIEQE